MQQEKSSKIIVNQKHIQKLVRTKVFEINNKHIKLPFFSVLPQNATDLRIVLEEFNPDSIIKTMPGEDDVDFLNAVLYRVFEYDNVVREQKSIMGQLTLNHNISTYKYFNQTKLKLIDPATELYRLRYKNYLKQYLSLEEIPDYLRDYLLKLISHDNLNLDAEHIKFWTDLFTSTEKGTLKSAHFLKWHWKRQKGRGADLFIPPTPYINLKSDMLIDKAIEMNHDAREFISDGEVSTIFNVNLDLFNNKKAIEKMTNYFDQAPTRITLFKFIDAQKILQPGFGQYAKRNFELFLRVIKSIKEEQPGRIFGVLNGGGFGYALLGADFDFFTDSVSNYPPYYFKNVGERTHRGMLNAETLTIEKFEGVKNIFKENNILMHECKICRKYKDLENISGVSRQQWSEDCRRHGLHLWNKFTKEYYEAQATEQERLFFDKIQNSDYAILGTILRNINSR